MVAPPLEGYLRKQGAGDSLFSRKSWKLRFFRLVGSELVSSLVRLFCVFIHVFHCPQGVLEKSG